ncbi:hypothetical protein GCM10020219_043970 [Nonomuraea dietziae]
MLALPALVAGPAAAQDFEAPNVVPSVPETGSLPGSIFVRWEHNANPCPGIGCVWDYSVERENPQRPETAEKRVDNVKGSERLLFDSGLQPNTEHRYRVCAFFITEDGDVECSEWTAGRTGPPEQPRQPNRPPRPRIVEEHAGETWIGIKWEAGHNYDSYFINVAGPFGTARGPRELRTIKHDDDGTWGYQRVDGLLPGRAYDFAVQGCRPTFLGIGDDQCFDWSTKVSFPHPGISAALRAAHLRATVRLAGGVRRRHRLCRGVPTHPGRRRQRPGPGAACVHLHPSQLHLHRARHLQGPLRLAGGAPQRPRVRPCEGTLAGGLRERSGQGAPRGPALMQVREGDARREQAPHGAATTRCRWPPRRSMPSSITSPGRR